jgi:hypothetical protein
MLFEPFKWETITQKVQTANIPSMKQIEFTFNFITNIDRFLSAHNNLLGSITILDLTGNNIEKLHGTLHIDDT